jgi:hypothetical protein
MTLKSITPFMAASLAALALAGTGCSSTSGNPQVANHDKNILGIYKFQPGAYTYAPPTGSVVHANQIISHPNMSGDKTTLLWGLITYEDY